MADNAQSHRRTLGPTLRMLLRGMGGLFAIAFAVCPSAADEYVGDEIHVQLADGVTIEEINARYGTHTLESLPPLYRLKLRGSQQEEHYLDQLTADPDIVDAEFAWENETPEGTRQMAVAAVGGTIDDYLDQNITERIHLADIHAHTKGDGILIAMIDGGVMADHPALEGVIEPGGWDFVDEDDDPSDTANGLDDDADGLTDEGAGHGTMVAGIIHLVAPNARILPIRVLDDEGWGDSFRVARALQYAVDHGADVINLSLGMTEESMVIEYEVGMAQNVSIPMISAAGNLGTEEPEYYPARDQDVLSVAALDSSDVKADFSSYNESVALSAPGVGVMAPYYDGEYAIGAGTSFAVPFVTGQCALILALNPSLTVDQVYQYAQLGVADGLYDDPANEVYDGQLGTGRVDLLQTWLSTPAAADVSLIAAVSDFRLDIYPNPARIGETVFLRLSRLEENPSAMIYDAAGRRIRTIESSMAGSGLLRWDGRDHRGRSVPAGTYFVRPISGGSADLSKSGRVIILDR